VSPASTRPAAIRFGIFMLWFSFCVFCLLFRCGRKLPRAPSSSFLIGIDFARDLL
jgi:hypothetical protein